MLWIGILIFALVIAVIILVNICLVRHYSDQEEREKLPTIITVLALTVAFLCVFLIPVDVWNVSTTTKDGVLAPGITIQMAQTRGTIIKVLYYVLYCLLFIFGFVLIPFAYFWYEEDDLDITFGRRFLGALKYSVFFLIAIIIILIIGLFLGRMPQKKGETVATWVAHLFDTQHAGEGAILFTLAILTVLGLVVWCIYSACGLSWLPISLLRMGPATIRERQEVINTRLAVTREQQRSIRAKYALSDRRAMTRRDRSDLQGLLRQERALKGAQDANQKPTLAEKCAKWTKPLRILGAIIFGAVSLLIVVSLVLTTIAKAKQHWGGLMLRVPALPNPIDLALTALARAFPMDYIFFSLLILFLVAATLSAIVAIGVFKLYKIAPHRTVPQGLLLLAALLLLAIFAINMEMFTLAPQYASFGNQVYLNRTAPHANTSDTAVVTRGPCSLQTAGNATCIMTQLGTTMNRIITSMPFFGVIFFYSNFLFFLCALLGVLVSLCRKRRERYAAGRAGDEEDEDDV
eukprot:gnl/Trimastix_PCT/2279.p2 GENE.gnl/Trimastix_PCT/2279~~gnl/Trimastix_PCT/2279.p2  ORF type:complete len:519 (+),score=141.55 gnl/Trimastix_PCT/2279:80-1636(+)